MPTYDFKCPKCEEIATLITQITEELIVPHCFKCKIEMKRDFRFGSIKFNGEGFYSNERK